MSDSKSEVSEPGTMNRVNQVTVGSDKKKDSRHEREKGTRLTVVKVNRQKVDNTEKGWKADKELGKIRWKTKEKLGLFFDIDDRAVSVAFIVERLKIDYFVAKRILEVMVKHGELEKIKTNSKPLYRRVSK